VAAEARSLVGQLAHVFLNMELALSLHSEALEEQARWVATLERLRAPRRDERRSSGAPQRNFWRVPGTEFVAFERRRRP
jgi:hypothetical protein